METALQFLAVAALFTAFGWYIGARWGLARGGLDPSPIKRLLGLD